MSVVCKRCEITVSNVCSEKNRFGEYRDTIYCDDCDIHYLSTGEEFFSGENEHEFVMVLKDKESNWNNGAGLLMFREWLEQPKKYAQVILSWLNDNYDDTEENISSFTIGQDDAADYWIVLEKREDNNV